MPITATCDECFTEYKVKEDLAGKKVKCRQCGAAVQIPKAGRSAPADEFSWTSDDAEADDREAPRLPSRKKASQNARSTKRSRHRSNSRPSIWRADLLTSSNAAWCAAVVAVGITLVLVPINVRISIGFAAIIGWLLQLAAVLVLLGIMFQEHVMCFILSMMFWPYLVWFMFSRWERTQRSLMISLAGFGFMGLAGAVQYLADNPAAAVPPAPINVPNRVHSDSPSPLLKLQALPGEKSTTNGDRA